MSEPVLPVYAPYAHSHHQPNYDYQFTSLQHQSIDKNITDSAKEVGATVNSAEQHITAGIGKLSDGVSNVSTGIRDSIVSNTLGLRDAIDRASVGNSTIQSNYAVASADRDRDLQVTVERTGSNNISATDRTSASILQSIERNAGESRYTSAVLDSASRQALNDSVRDIITQMNRNDNELLTATDRVGTANITAINASGYETRTLVNANSNMLSSAICSSTEKLASQAAAQYASLLLEQHKAKECLSQQMADAKYEALKNKEGLSAQLAAASCETKYEALKNTQMLSSQMAECCCEIKGSVKDVSSKIDDTLRTLDTQRIRDALNVANNEINLLRTTSYYNRRSGSPRRSRSPRRD